MGTSRRTNLKYAIVHIICQSIIYNAKTLDEVNKIEVLLKNSQDQNQLVFKS
jgi:hypothetical protein